MEKKAQVDSDFFLMFLTRIEQRDFFTLQMHT